MDTHSFIVYVKTEEICKNIAKYVEKRFDTLNYELETPILTEKNKKVIIIMTNKLGRKQSQSLLH